MSSVVRFCSWVLLALALTSTCCSEVDAQGATAVREGSGASSRTGAAGPPVQNAQCDRAAARTCQAEARQMLDDCKFSLLIDCRSHALLNYSDCKAEAGCR
jgi:hypothetical protein